MVILIALLLLGVLAGYLLRKKPLKIQPVITILVWILLFCLGMGVGNNPQLVSGLGRLGGDALLLAVGGTLGSISTAGLLGYWVKRWKKSS